MENKEIKVIIINDFDYVQGGASQIALQTAELLHGREINVSLFSATHLNKDSKINVYFTDQNEAINNKKNLKSYLHNLWNPVAYKKLNRLLANYDTENTLVHIHGWTKILSASIFYACKKMGFKVVLTTHDYFCACPNGGFFSYPTNKVCKYKAMSMKCIFSQCDSRNIFYKYYRILRQSIQNKVLLSDGFLEHIIYISKKSKEVIEPYFPCTDSTIIYNPVKPANKIVLSDIEKLYDCIFVGRLSYEKGPDLFCEAVSGTNLNSIVVGDGPLFIELKNKFQDITFVGWKERVDVYDLLSKSKLLVFSSKLYETAGLSVLEAVSCGTPCVVSNITAASEFIDKENGVLYNPELANDLSDKIQICLTKFNGRIKHSTVVNKFIDNEERYVDSLIKVYSEVLFNDK